MNQSDENILYFSHLCVEATEIRPDTKWRWITDAKHLLRQSYEINYDLQKIAPAGFEPTPAGTLSTQERRHRNSSD